MNPNLETSTISSFDQIRKRTLISLIFVVLLRSLVLLGGYLTLFQQYDRGVVIAGAAFFAGIYTIWLVLALNNILSVAAIGLAVTLSIEVFLGDTVISGASLAMLVLATLIPNRLVFQVLASAFWITVLYITSLTSGNELALEELSLLAVLIGIAISVRFFLRSIVNTLQNAERNAELLRISAEVGQVTAGITDLDDLLERAVNYVRDRFGYYHVQVFLLDDTGDVAVLRASTGEVGRILLENKHRLNVGSESVIGRVTLTGEPLNYGDTAQVGVHYRNELLPKTRAELAIAIRDGERIIGALDVQSTQPNTFGRAETQSLQIMANLLAASIRNAILFQDQQRNLQENQRLYIETQANLREIQRLNQQLTGDSWRQFTTDLGDNNGLTLEGNSINRDLGWTSLLTQAAHTRQIIIDENKKRVAVPILLRGEVIGAMEIEPDETLDEGDTVEIIRSVADRLAVSLDNARLFEESQETTQYEQRINQIVGQYQNANTVDELLQITLKELSDTLGASRSAIRLSTPREDETEPINGHNGVTSSS